MCMRPIQGTQQNKYISMHSCKWMHLKMSSSFKPRQYQQPERKSKWTTVAVNFYARSKWTKLGRRPFFFLCSNRTDGNLHIQRGSRKYSLQFGSLILFDLWAWLAFWKVKVPPRHKVQLLLLFQSDWTMFYQFIILMTCMVWAVICKVNCQSWIISCLTTHFHDFISCVKSFFFISIHSVGGLRRQGSLCKIST